MTKDEAQTLLTTMCCVPRVFCPLAERTCQPDCVCLKPKHLVDIVGTPDWDVQPAKCNNHMFFGKAQ